VDGDDDAGQSFLNVTSVAAGHVKLENPSLPTSAQFGFATLGTSQQTNSFFHFIKTALIPSTNGTLTLDKILEEYRKLNPCGEKIKYKDARRFLISSNFIRKGKEIILCCT